MLNKRYLKYMVAVWAAATVLVFSFISHEHLHSVSTSGNRHLVKHWHYEEDCSGSVGACSEQDDHKADSIVEIVFKAGAKFAVTQPVLVAEMLFTPPDHPQIGYMQAYILPVTYGPPHLPVPSRAPPLPASPIL